MASASATSRYGISPGRMARNCFKRSNRGSLPAAQELLAEPMEDGIEQGQCPAFFVQSFRGQMIFRLDPAIAILAAVEIERNRAWATAPLPGPAASPLVGQEVFDRSQQERTKLAAPGIRDRQVVLGQEAGEELRVRSWASSAE